MFFFALFAACRHTNQFNESLKKAFYRSQRQHQKNLAKQQCDGELANMSVASETSLVKELEKIPKES